MRSLLAIATFLGVVACLALRPAAAYDPAATDPAVYDPNDPNAAPQLAGTVIGPRRRRGDTPSHAARDRIAHYRRQLQAIPIRGTNECMGPSVRIDIEFGFDSAQLTASARRELDALRFVLQEPDFRATAFEINGHTDAPGEDTYNMRLSQARAESVRRYLTSASGLSGRLRACGYGEQFPKVRTEAPSQTNRRVEISNLGCGMNRAYSGC